MSHSYRALLTPEIEEWHQHQVARRFLIRQRKQQQAEAAEALAQQALLEQQHTPETAAIPISKDLPSVSTKHPSSASSAYPVPTYVAYGPSDEFAVDDTGSETGRRTVSVKTGSPNHVPSSAQSPQKGLILASDMGSGTSSPAPRSASPSKGFVGQLSPSRNVRSLTKSAASDGGSPERDRLRGPSDVRSRSRESEGSLGSSAVAGTRERAVSGSLARSGAKAKEKDSDIDVSVRSASPLRPPGSDGDSMLFKRFLEGAGREPPQSGLTGSTGTRIASGGDQHRGSSRNSESKAGGLGAEDSLPDRTANRTMPPGALSLEREKRGSASRLTPIDTNFGTITRSPPGMPSSMPPKSSAGRRSYEFPPFQPVNVGFEEDDPMIYASAAPLVSMLIDTEKLAGVSDALFDGIDAAKSRFEKAGKKMFGALTFANARKRHRERTAGALDEGPEMEEGESGEPQGRRSLDLPSPGIGARPVPAQSWSVRLPGWPSSSGSTEPKSSRLGSDRIPVPRMSATTPDLGDSPPSDVTKLLPGNASASALQSLRTGTPQPQRSTSKPQLFRSATPQPTPSAPPASQTLPIMHLPGLLPVLKSRSFASISGPDHGEVGASGRFAWEDANQPGLLASSGHRDSSRNAMSDDEKDDAAESGRSRRSERPESRLRKKRSASMDNLPEIKELIQPQGTRDREQEKGEVFPGESEPQLLSESLKAGIEKKKPAGLLGIFRASSSTGRGSSSKREAGPPAEPDNVMIPTRLDSRDISEVRASGSATGALPERLHSIAEIDVGDSSVKDRVSAPATPDVELGAAEWPKPEQRWSRKDLNELELTLARQGSMLFADQSLKLANIRMPKDLQGISDRLETVTAGYEGMSGRIDTVASKVEQMLKLRQEAADLLSHLTSTPALPLLFGERIRPEHQRGPSHESFEGVGSSFARRHTSFSSFGEPSGLESRGTSPTRSLMNLTSFGAGTPAFGGCVRPMEDPGSVPPSPLSPELMRSQELRGRNRSGSGITFASEDVPLPDPATQTERLRAASEAASALLPRALAVQKQYHDLDVSIQQLSNKLSAWSDEVNKSWLPALHAAEEELERLEDRGRKQGQTWEEAGFLVLSWVLATLGSIIWIVYHAQVTMRASVKTGMDWAYGVLDRIGIADPLNRFWKELLESDAEAGRQLGPTMQRMPCSFGSQGQGQRTNAE